SLSFLAIALFVYVASTPLISPLSLHDALPISDLHLFEPFDKDFGLEPFWGDIQKFIVAINAVVQNGVDFSFGHPRIDGCSKDVRSEEHTSELQSRENLVCRLLLEKKKAIAHNK